MVPRGFEQVAHPVFASFALPLEEGEEQKKRPPPKMALASFEAADEALALPLPKAAHHVPQQQLPQRPSSRLGEMDDDIHCSICLDEYKHPVVVVTAQCLHKFCRACITRWLSMNQPSSFVPHAPSCPLCKRPVTWLLSLSASSNPTPPFRFVLVAVGTDADQLEKQPWPSPALLQDSRQRQLDLYEARVRKEQQEAQKEARRKRKHAKRNSKRRGKEEEEQKKTTRALDNRPLTEKLQDELRRVDSEIAQIKTSIQRKT